MEPALSQDKKHVEWPGSRDCAAGFSLQSATSLGGLVFVDLSLQKDCARKHTIISVLEQTAANSAPHKDQAQFVIGVKDFMTSRWVLIAALDWCYGLGSRASVG